MKENSTYLNNQGNVGVTKLPITSQIRTLNCFCRIENHFTHL